jgi:DNA-binding beta-propeller fold protein YncE
MALNPALAQVVTTIPIGANSASSVDVNPNTNRIFTSGGAATGQVVTMVDGNTNTIVMVMGTGSGARVNPMTNKVYAGAFTTPPNSFLVYDAGTGSLIKTITTGGCPIEAALDSVSNRIWGAGQCGNSDDPIWVLDGAFDSNRSGVFGSGGAMGPLVVNPVTHIGYANMNGNSTRRIDGS